MSVQFDIESFEPAAIQHAMGDYWIRVSDQISLLNRMIYLEWASARVIAGWVPGASEFEWKTEMAKHLWQNMKIAERLLERKEELSSNRKILIPSEPLHAFVQEASRADSFPAFAAGWYLEATTQMIASYERLCEVLDPIFDEPTLLILEEILPKKREQVRWAARLVHDAVHDTGVLFHVQRWRAFVKHRLAAIGGLEEQAERSEVAPENPVAVPAGPAPAKRARPSWLIPGDYATVPEMFKDSMKVFMWHYVTEIQVIDPMCYVFYGADDLPFEFYVDFSRHIWDETRHHRMGVRRLRQLGYDLKDMPIPYSEDALQELEFFYGMLTMVGESCSFSRKKKSMEAYYEQGDLISGMTAEMDIVDERNHVKFGKKWTPLIYQKRLGDNSSLDEIVKSVMKKLMAGNGDFNDMTEEDKDRLSHFAFCGRIEFKYLNYERL